MDAQTTLTEAVNDWEKPAEGDVYGQVISEDENSVHFKITYSPEGAMSGPVVSDQICTRDEGQSDEDFEKKFEEAVGAALDSVKTAYDKNQDALNSTEGQPVLAGQESDETQETQAPEQKA